MEFAGGGTPSTEPKIVSPIGTQIDFNGESTKTVTVRALNLSEALTIAVTGMTSNLQTISANDAENGVQLTLTKGQTFTGGTLRIYSSEVDKSWNVIDSQEGLPTGYTELNSISDITDFITTNINAQGTTWEIDASAGSQTTYTELLINYGSGSIAAGTFAAGTIDGKWGLGGNVSTSVPKTQRSTIAVAFTASGVTMTIGNETINRAASSPQNSEVLLFGRTNATTNNYLLKGTIYSVKCTAGGSFNGVPAKRTSDNKEGIYDLANDVFYPLK